MDKPWAHLSEQDIDRIIGMAWEDKTPFDAIKLQFSLTPDQTRALMRDRMKPSSYIMWRRRMEATPTKHLANRTFSLGRFKSKNQR